MARPRLRSASRRLKTSLVRASGNNPEMKTALASANAVAEERAVSDRLATDWRMICHEGDDWPDEFRAPSGIRGIAFAHMAFDASTMMASSTTSPTEAIASSVSRLRK